MKVNYLVKDGSLNKIAKEKIQSLQSGKFQLLSNFYASRSTNVASVFYTDLFIIERNKEEIVKNGFSRNASAIVKVNLKNKHVVKFLTELKKDKKEAEKRKKKAEKEFNQMVVLGKKFIRENKKLVSEIKEKHPGNSKGLQDVAWKLSNRAATKGIKVTKTAMYHALT